MALLSSARSLRGAFWRSSRTRSTGSAIFRLVGMDIMTGNLGAADSDEAAVANPRARSASRFEKCGGGGGPSSGSSSGTS